MRSNTRFLAIAMAVCLVCVLGLYAAFVYSTNHSPPVSPAVVNNSSGQAPANLSGASNLSTSLAPDEPDRSDSVYFGLEYAPKKYYQDANVTLHRVTGYNASTGEDDLSFVDIPGNPLNTTNGIIGGMPVYRFDNVPGGSYQVTAEKGGRVWTAYTKSGGFVYLTVEDLSITVPDDVNLSNSTIYGYVRDLTGAYIPGAVVSIAGASSNPNGSLDASGVQNRSVVTLDGSHVGFYSFGNLTPGRYTITCEKDGYNREQTVIDFNGRDTKGLEVRLWMTRGK